MAVPRVLSVAPHSALKFAGPSIRKTCTSSTRHFTSSMSIRLSSKRKLVTTSHYRPETLQPPPPPPRNAGGADTSISGAIPQVSETRPPGSENNGQESVSARQEEATSISVPEREAQKSKPPAAPAPAATTELAPKPKRPKLRPRKAAMKLTATAVDHLREMLEQPDPRYIRVGVKNRGCSGLAYHLEYVERPAAFDEAVEQDGVTVLVDSKALFSIIGSEMDWVEDKLNQRFVFRNPNISE